MLQMQRLALLLMEQRLQSGKAMYQQWIQQAKCGLGVESIQVMAGPALGTQSRDQKK
jgi:hypothetical protein